MEQSQRQGAAILYEIQSRFECFYGLVLLASYVSLPPITGKSLQPTFNYLSYDVSMRKLPI
jgi:hypothetical protein